MLSDRDRALLRLEGRDEYRDTAWTKAAVIIDTAEHWEEPDFKPMDLIADHDVIQALVDIIQEQAVHGPCPFQRRTILENLGLWPDPAKMDIRSLPTSGPPAPPPGTEPMGV